MAVYHTEEQLEEIGRDLRRRIGLEHQACLDVMTVINKLKHVDPAFNYRRVPDKICLTLKPSGIQKPP